MNFKLKDVAVSIAEAARIIPLGKTMYSRSRLSNRAQHLRQRTSRRRQHTCPRPLVESYMVAWADRFTNTLQFEYVCHICGWLAQIACQRLRYATGVADCEPLLAQSTERRSGPPARTVASEARGGRLRSYRWR